jgi:hypothetical protein
MLKTKPSSLFRVDEDEVLVGDGGGGTAPTEAQMRLLIAQTLSMDFVYNAPVVVLKFDVAENGNITGVFKDAARPRVFSFTLDGESVAYKPYKPGKMDSLESEEDVQEWEAFSAGYGFRVDAGVGGKKKPQCVKPTAYNCGAACINIMKTCKIKTNDPTIKDRLKKLEGIGKDYAKTAKTTVEKPQTKPKAESKKPTGQKLATKKTAEPEAKIEPKPEVKPKVKSSPKSKANPFYSDEPIKDYDTFKKEIVKEAARVAFELGQGDRVNIAQMRHELKDRVSKEDFDKWTLKAGTDDEGIELETGTLKKEDMNPDGQFDPSDGITDMFNRNRQSFVIKDTKAIEKAKQEFKRKPGQMSDQKEIQKEISTLLKDIDKEGNHGGLVPIYKIRDAMGDKVGRGDFNRAMLDLHENDLFTLNGVGRGEYPPGSDINKRYGDGIQNAAGKMRSFAQVTK